MGYHGQMISVTERLCVIIGMLLEIGFLIMVSSLICFHTYLASKNLTTCKSLLTFRGISLLDEDNIFKDLA
jgi:hypothetical protein